MEPDYWHKKWAAQDLGFHLPHPHPFLVAHLSALGLAEGARIFVPLCGKTPDIGWLLAQGHHVVGAELSEIAIRALFEDLGIAPDVSEDGPLLRFRAPGLDVLVGDVFDVNAERLGPVDAVYDRAAAVALPPDLRLRYATHVTGITGRAPQLLIAFEYAEGLVSPPPFALDAMELARLYADTHAMHELARRRLPNGLKGMQEVEETLWQLVPRRGA